MANTAAGTSSNGINPNWFNIGLRDEATTFTSFNLPLHGIRYTIQINRIAVIHEGRHPVFIC